MKLYAIYSKSSKLYDTPFPCENDARVIYELRHLVNTHKDTPIGSDPSDHSLVCVGLFDTETGKIKHQHDVILKDLGKLVKAEVSNG